MPRVPFPDERVLVDRQTRHVRGRECEVYVYEETHSALFGLFTWDARHVRVEVPVRLESKVRLVHDTRGRGGPTELPSRQEHVHEALAKAEEWVDRRDEIHKGVA